jgi:hypothetical protein
MAGVGWRCRGFPHWAGHAHSWHSLACRKIPMAQSKLWTWNSIVDRTHNNTHRRPIVDVRNAKWKWNDHPNFIQMYWFGYFLKRKRNYTLWTPVRVWMCASTG